MGGQQSWVKRWGRTRGCITGVRLLFWTFSIKNPLETLSQCAEVHGSKMALSLSLKAKTSFYALIKKLKTVAYFMSRMFSNDFKLCDSEIGVYVIVAARYCTIIPWWLNIIKWQKLFPLFLQVTTVYLRGKSTPSI